MKATVKKYQIKFDFKDYDEQIAFVRALNIACSYCCIKHDCICDECPLAELVDTNGTDLCTNVMNMLFIRP